jgi:uncharacterized membrane protein
MTGVGSTVIRLLARLAASAISAVLVGFSATLIAYWVGYALIDVGLIKIDALVDDDAALKNVGIAMIGGLAGLVIGAVLGWRLSRPRR